MSLIISAIAVPSYRNTVAYLRAAGDGRALNGLTAQAKMRAAASFTHTRVYADLSNGAYQLQVWDKVKGCWVEDSDRNTTLIRFCITYTTAHQVAQSSRSRKGTPLDSEASLSVRRRANPPLVRTNVTRIMAPA